MSKNHQLPASHNPHIAFTLHRFFKTFEEKKNLKLLNVFRYRRFGTKKRKTVISKIRNNMISNTFEIFELFYDILKCNRKFNTERKYIYDLKWVCNLLAEPQSLCKHYV